MTFSPLSPELVVDAELGDPRLVGDVLQPAGTRVEVDREGHGERERQHRAGQGDPAGGGRHEQAQDAGGQGEPEQVGELEHQACRRK